jgi:mono/diheme cytochrome c family protein
MRYIHLIAPIAVASLVSIVTSAQQAPAPAGGRGRIAGAGIGAYPVREPGDPAAIERGRSIYSTNCAFCHGADIRGGDGGPSLLRSQVVLDDQNGERIGPVVQAGRPDQGMPKFAMSNDQIADIATFLHTFRVAGYDVSRQKPASILVGDAQAGAAAFKSKCASCHSATGDLQGLATRVSDPRTLQQSWLMPGSTVGRGGSMPARAASAERHRDAAVGTEVRGRARTRGRLRGRLEASRWHPPRVSNQ